MERKYKNRGMEKVSCLVVYWLQESFDKRKAGLYNVVYTCKS